MNKMKLIITAPLLAFGLMLAGCDIIDAPYGVQNSIPTDTGDDVQRKILLEDFTGHICQACPDAHREAKRLHGIYGDQLVTIGIHAGFFASTNIYPGFTYNFTNPTGIAIATDFSVINLPFPKGMINRMVDPSNGNRLILDWAAWEAKIAQWLQEPADAGIEITPGYNAGNRDMTADIKVKILDDIGDPVSLAVYFTEDSIIKPQKDGTTNVQDYVHMHVLRGSFNGTYGEDLGTVTKNSEISKSYTVALTPNDAVPEHTHLVAILFNNTTKEVIQVEEILLLE